MEETILKLSLGIYSTTSAIQKKGFQKFNELNIVQNDHIDYKTIPVV